MPLDEVEPLPWDELEGFLAGAHFSRVLSSQVVVTLVLVLTMVALRRVMQIYRKLR